MCSGCGKSDDPHTENTLVAIDINNLGSMKEKVLQRGGGSRD